MKISKSKVSNTDKIPQPPPPPPPPPFFEDPIKKKTMTLNRIKISVEDLKNVKLRPVNKTNQKMISGY